MGVVLPRDRTVPASVVIGIRDQGALTTKSSMLEADPGDNTTVIFHSTKRCQEACDCISSVAPFS